MAGTVSFVLFPASTWAYTISLYRQSPRYSFFFLIRTTRVTVFHVTIMVYVQCTELHWRAYGFRQTSAKDEHTPHAETPFFPRGERKSGPDVNSGIV